MTNAPDKADRFAQVKRARELVVGVNVSISPATQQQYRVAYARMDARGSAPEAMANTSRSFYYYRAAWVHHHSNVVRNLLNAADRMQRAGDTTGWEAAVSELPAAIAQLERYRPDPTGMNLAHGMVGKWAVEAEKRDRAGQRLTQHSKRVRLRGLPMDWRAQMFSGLRPSSKYRDVVAVLSATGARPAEFEHGIEVTIGPAHTLHFKIFGVKTHGGKYGQVERSFNVATNRPELQYLRERVESNAGHLSVKASAGALSDKIRQLSEKVFPKLKSAVSAYVFRHQMSADLKASDIPHVEVSAALGHSVDETKGYYGAAQSARSVGGVTGIVATRIVREKTREKLREFGRERGKTRER